jgi:hypothetical protein
MDVCSYTLYSKQHPPRTTHNRLSTTLPVSANPAQPIPHTQIGIADAQTRVAFVDPASGHTTALLLPIGTHQLGAGPFGHTPPTPLELEHAIEAVENVVMPLAKVLPAGTALHTADAHGHTLAALARPGGSATTTVSIDDVERVFNQLVAVSEGRPTASSELPPDPAFAAWALILREFMHHLRIGALTINAA